MINVAKVNVQHIDEILLKINGCEKQIIIDGKYLDLSKVRSIKIEIDPYGTSAELSVLDTELPCKPNVREKVEQ